MISEIKFRNIFSCCFISLVFVVNHNLNAQEMDIENTQKVYTIENCVNQFSMDNTVKTDVGYQYWFADKDFLDGRTLKMSVVAPHKSTHAPHKHIEDEFFFILEGTASFYLDGKTTVVGKYTSLYCPSNVMHGISNAGDSELKYLVVKKYQKD
jgi:mannose-6-phosphate isomerase-like protein (cupin superfamily)